MSREFAGQSDGNRLGGSARVSQNGNVTPTKARADRERHATLRARACRAPEAAHAQEVPRSRKGKVGNACTRASRGNSVGTSCSDSARPGVCSGSGGPIIGAGRGPSAFPNPNLDINREAIDTARAVRHGHGHRRRVGIAFRGIGQPCEIAHDNAGNRHPRAENLEFLPFRKAIATARNDGASPRI